METLFDCRPLPEVTPLKNKKATAILLAPIYSATHGKYNSYMRYVCHYGYFKLIGDEQTAKIMMGIALCEKEHVNCFEQILNNLGEGEIMKRENIASEESFCSPNIFSGKTPERILTDDVAQKMVALFFYKKVQSSNLEKSLKSLLLCMENDEKLHLNKLKDRLNEIKKMCVEQK